MSNLLSPLTQAYLKKQSELVFNDLCQVFHVTFMTGTYSDVDGSTSTSAGAIPCAIEFNDGRFREMRENPQVVILDYDAMLTVSVDVDIRKDDAIVLMQKGQFRISGSFIPSSEPVSNSTVQHVFLKRKIT